MSLCTLRYLLSCRPEVGTLPPACLGPRWLRAVLAHIEAVTP